MNIRTDISVAAVSLAWRQGRDVHVPQQAVGSISHLLGDPHWSHRGFDLNSIASFGLVVSLMPCMRPGNAGEHSVMVGLESETFFCAFDRGILCMRERTLESNLHGAAVVELCEFEIKLKGRDEIVLSGRARWQLDS